jgi:hypothetical protein
VNIDAGSGLPGGRHSFDLNPAALNFGASEVAAVTAKDFNMLFCMEEPESSSRSSGLKEGAGAGRSNLIGAAFGLQAFGVGSKLAPIVV